MQLSTGARMSKTKTAFYDRLIFAVAHPEREIELASAGYTAKEAKAIIEIEDDINRASQFN